MKKIFIISGACFVLILVLFGIYNFAFKNNASNPIADPVKKALSLEKSISPPSSITSGLEALVNEATLGAVLRGNKLRYYSTGENALKESDVDGESGHILFAAFPGPLTRLLWSPQGDMVLALITTETGPLWHLFSLPDQKLTPLKKEMSRLAWTNLGDNILYQFTDSVTGRSSLNLARPDGSNWKKLADLGGGSYSIVPVPQSSLVSFWKRPNGLEANSLERVSLTGGESKTLLSNLFGGDLVWSHDGAHALVGSVPPDSRFTPTLGLINENGGEYHNLFTPTLLNKVVWSGDNKTVFYALPSAFPQEAILPNDYFGKPLYTTDTFWRMNVLTGKKERLVSLEAIQTPLDATELFLSSDETNLFFTDRKSGKIYRIGL